jgi:DNA-binding transcriptional ArsR family regulator
MRHIKSHLAEQHFENIDSSDQIRNIKCGDWFWISRACLLSHGRALKPSGIAVYNVLASFANSKTQSCFPTHKTIAKIAGTSKRTVSEKIRLLEKLRLIRLDRQEGQSIYQLLECDQVKKVNPEGQSALFEGEKSDR